MVRVTRRHWPFEPPHRARAQPRRLVLRRAPQRLPLILAPGAVPDAHRRWARKPSWRQLRMPELCMWCWGARKRTEGWSLSSQRRYRGVALVHVDSVVSWPFFSLFGLFDFRFAVYILKPYPLRLSAMVILIQHRTNTNTAAQHACARHRRQEAHNTAAQHARARHRRQGALICGTYKKTRCNFSLRSRRGARHQGTTITRRPPRRDTQGHCGLTRLR
jgi:hypothetical protein